MTTLHSDAFVFFGATGESTSRWRLLAAGKKRIV
jgi:hypothetical protein